MSPCTSPPEENAPPALLCSPESLLPVPVDTATDALQVPVSTATIPAPVFKISVFEKSEYRADVLDAAYPAQAGRLVDLNHVEKLCIMFLKRR